MRTQASEYFMSSIRTTNLLLAIIAACLLAIVGRTVIPDVIPSAYAATPMRVEGPVAVYVHGCSVLNATWGCQKWSPITMTPQGALPVQGK